MSSNIPKLRFAEFGGDWQETDLGSIASFSKGKGISKSEISKDGKIPCIRYGELYTQYSEIIDRAVSFTNSSEDLVYSEANDVIIPASGETAIDISTASCVKESGIALGGDINIIKTKHNGVFLSYYLNSKKKQDIANLAQGISVIHLYANQLASLRVYLPDFSEEEKKSEEQDKIADFLATVSKRIEGLETMMDLQKRYKQGVMQRIFNQTIRFKDNNGNPFPDWQEIRLGKAFKLQGGFAFKSEEFTDLGIPIIRISNIPIIGDNIDLSDCIYYEEIPNELNFIVNNGDLVIAMSGATTGKTAIYRYPNKAYLNQRVGLFKLVDNNNHYPFIYHLVKSTSFMTQLKSTLVAGAQPNISSKDIESFIVNFPEKDEQKKIADFLSDLDAKIEATQKQLDAAREWKKGLLQKMFV